MEAHPADLARGGGQCHLAADHPAHTGIGFQSRYVSLDLQRNRAHGQHASGNAEHAPHLVEGGDRVGEHVGETRQDQVADRVPRQAPAATQPVLYGRGPHTSAGAVGGQRRQRHPQITGWHDPELGTNAAGGAAVIGHSDHRGDVVGEPPRRRQRRVEAVPATERDDARLPPGQLGVLRDTGAHSRPRSRCNTRTDRSSSGAKDAASASVIATLRCLPPVHPTAIVM
ncbi:Uncharacterised protein [Mycobacteroides abscessus subsp. abscessus]|nr:Uncharacterised protein [Mycobacteroides abscessus subsp. abscessus]